MQQLRQTAARVAAVSEAVQTQLSPIFWPLFAGGCAGTALTNFLAAVAGSRAGPPLINFLTAVLPEAVQAQLFSIFWQLLTGGCAGAALTNFLVAVVLRLCRRSSQRCSGSCFLEAVEAAFGVIWASR